jgi:hypothetical protein
MMIEKQFRRRFQTKGVAYSLDEFATRYELDDKQAEELFFRFGPSSIDLDLLMAAKAARRRELPFVGE